MSAPRHVARAVVLSALALSGAGAATFTASPAALAQAQTAVTVVQLPFTGDATEDLLGEAYGATRNALLARGAQGPDRTAVSNAMGVSPPADTAAIVAFGRSMGASHVLTGRVTPLTGQYNLTLRLYEVSTGRVAEQHDNIGEGTEATAIPPLLEALFAPGALQLSPEERARAEEERRRAEEERRRAEEERRRQEEQRRRDEEARRRAEEARRRAEAERDRRVYRFAEGGPISFGASAWFGGRLDPLMMRPAMQPQPSAFVWGLRVEGGYAVLPSIGLEVGGTLVLLGSPSNALMIAPTARISLPASGYIPLRGSAGASVGLYQGITGAQTTSLWLGLDVRAEFDIVPMVTAFAGATVDGVPGAFASLGALAGLRFHFGGAEAPAAPAPQGNPGGPQGAAP